MFHSFDNSFQYSMASRLTDGSFPPGVRFYPSDEELIVHYLLKKVNSHPLPACIIADVELYNYNPWDLPKFAFFGEDEWFFFSPRDRKYPKGFRPNRTTASGYWKATGIDKPIHSSDGSKIGVKKSLVFYVGKAPSGMKTEWCMMEYRLPKMTAKPSRPTGSMRLDDWVLCRVRVQQKGNMSKNGWEAQRSPQEPLNYLSNNENVPSLCNSPNYFLAKDSPLIYSMIVQGLLPLENIPVITSQFSNTHVPNSSLPSFLNTSSMP